MRKRTCRNGASKLTLLIPLGLLALGGVLVAVFIWQGRGKAPAPEAAVRTALAKADTARAVPSQPEEQNPPKAVEAPAPSAQVTHTDLGVEATRRTPDRPTEAAVPDDPVGRLRSGILEGPYGKMPIRDLLNLSLATRDPSRVEMQLALLLRKDECLPLLKSELLNAADDRQYDILMLIQGQLRWAETVPEIVALLENRQLSERIRGRAATAAALFQKKEAIPLIRELLVTGTDIQARQWAAMALGHLQDRESIAAVESMLADESAYACVTAAMVLGQLGSDAGLPIALKLSHHERFDVRSRAAEALSYMASTEVVARLQQMEQTDSSRTVRSESSEVLVRMQIEALDSGAALTRLRQLLSVEQPPRWAFVYLAEHYGYEASDFLRSLAAGSGPLQHAAIVSLIEQSAGIAMISPSRQGKVDE